jgi:hypothetical protein
MPKKLIKRFTPDHQSIKENKYLKISAAFYTTLICGISTAIR